MLKHRYLVARWLFFCVCTASIVLFLAGCDLFGGGSPSTGTTVTPTPTTSLTTYKGDGFSISYPQSWKAKQSSEGVTFSDPNGIAYLSIRTTPNPNELIPASTVVDTALQAFKSQAKNYQSVSTSATTTLAGDTWSQGAATGDITPSGQNTAVNVKIVVIADNHPAHSISSKDFAIGYATGSQVFDLANTAYFQPMLQSFKFV